MTLRHAPRHLQGLPTLTEVIDLPLPDGIARPAAPPVSTLALSELPAAAAAPSVSHEDDAELLARVQVDVQRQLEQMLEQRLREVIEPVLARAGEDLIRELRAEIDAMLPEAVALSVSRQRTNRPDR